MISADPCENASFGSHDKPLLVCRGLLTTHEKPTMNSEYEFIVATPAIFICGGEFENVLGQYEIRKKEEVWTCTIYSRDVSGLRELFK